jgi:hypothetical protein
MLSSVAALWKDPVPMFPMDLPFQPLASPNNLPQTQDIGREPVKHRTGQKACRSRDGRRHWVERTWRCRLELLDWDDDGVLKGVWFGDRRGDMTGWTANLWEGGEPRKIRAGDRTIFLGFGSAWRWRRLNGPPGSSKMEATGSGWSLGNRGEP